MCNGQLMSISQNPALFSLLGTFYGGDGRATFALPDLRGRVPMHTGTNANGTYTIGEAAGESTVTLISTQMPAHLHSLQGSTAAANSKLPLTNAVYATTKTGAGVSPGDNYYGSPSPPLTELAPASVGTTGGSQPHSNLQPYLVINWCIALTGIFPSRN